MLEKIINFIKYNNATVIILALVLILGGGALAAGPEAIGQKQTTVQGTDNTVLLSADLDKFSLDFKIENIEQDDKYYYVTYSFLDIALANSAWQYQLSQRTQKVSRKIKDDLGVYLAKFLAKHYEARVRELKQAQTEARAQGAQKRVEVTEYSGLVGLTLDLAAKVFPGYEPVKKIILTPPNFDAPISTSSSASSGQADNLMQVYNNYLAAHPEIFSKLNATSSPAIATSTPAQNPPSPLYQERANAASTTSAIRPLDSGPTATSTSVQVIDLPAAAAATTAPALEPSIIASSTGI